MTVDETERESFEWLPGVMARHGVTTAPPRVRRFGIGTRAGGISGLRWGDAAPRVLFLHGGGQNAHTWDLVAALLDEPAVALDLPGHGHSDWRDDHDYTPASSASTIAAALDAVSIRPEIVVGMSLGGLTATALLGARSDLVPALALVDILPAVPGGRDRAPADRGQVALLDGPRVFDSLEDMVAAALRLSPGRNVEDLRRGIVHNAARTDDGRYRWRYDDVRATRESPTSDLWASFRLNPSPLMLVRAGTDSFVPDDALDLLRATRPDAEVVTVPGARHAVQSTSPDELTALLRGFVADVDRAAGRRDA